MPKCPKCQTLIQEDAPQCFACKFTLLELDDLLGEAPVLASHATDLSESLPLASLQKVNTRLTRFQRRFPQCRFAVVFDTTPEEVSLNLYTFWGFNRWGLSHQMKKSGDCLMILLVIDVSTNQACAMTGYGFEPLISDSILSYWLESIKILLQKGDFTEAALKFYAGLVEDLKNLPDRLENCFGISAETHGEGEAFPY